MAEQESTPGADLGVSGALAAFDYDNLPDRPPGRLVTLAGRVLPGVARVQAEAEPYAAAWARDNRAATSASGPLWVALGDSLSQGVGASSYDRGWVGQLRTRLASARVPMRLVNLSVSGARTQDVLHHQLPALARLRDLVGAPALVTLMIGSNDIVSRSHRVGLGARMARILDALPDRSVVMTLPNPTPAAHEVNAAVAAAAERLVVVEMRDPRTATWRGRLADDHFHPNDVGYAAITDVIADALTKVWRIQL